MATIVQNDGCVTAFDKNCWMTSQNTASFKKEQKYSCLQFTTFKMTGK